MTHSLVHTTWGEEKVHKITCAHNISLWNFVWKVCVMERERERERLCVFVCVCVCVCARERIVDSTSLTVFVVWRCKFFETLILSTCRRDVMEGRETKQNFEILLLMMLLSVCVSYRCLTSKSELLFSLMIQWKTQFIINENKYGNNPIRDWFLKKMLSYYLHNIWPANFIIFTW